MFVSKVSYHLNINRIYDDELYIIGMRSFEINSNQNYESLDSK